MSFETFNHCAVLGSWIYQRGLIFLPQTTNDVIGGGRSYRLAEILVLRGHWSMMIAFGQRDWTLLDVTDGLGIFDCHQSLFLKLLLRANRFLAFSKAVAV